MTNILILEPSTSGLQILPTAYSMGLKVFVLSANQDERVIPQEYHQYIFKQIHVDTNSFSAISEATLQINKEHTLSAIIPGFEIYVSLAAQLAKLIGTPGISDKTGEALRNKGKMRNILKQNNVRVPNYYLLNSANEITEISKHINFPCVIKPIDQSGSIHVSKIDNKKELIDAYKAMCEDDWTEMNKGIGEAAIVEEYVHGEEFSVEGYISDEIEIISITKKFLTPEPLFIEMGHIVPANISTESESIIKSYVHQVIKALNINLGVFHAELRLDSAGPVLMEIAGRLPGCRICDLIFLAKGINMYETMIRAHLGWPIIKAPQANAQYAGMCYFDLNGKNVFNQIEGLEKLKETIGFYDFKLFKNPGEFVPPLTTFQGRVASCIFTAPTYSELVKRLQLAKSIISFS
jgi:biotin carboxylase